MSAQATTPQNGQCRLLTIAPELRNAICEYALTEGTLDVLVTYVGSRRIFRLCSRRTEFQASDRERNTDDCTFKELNQLKYVCRQLRHETLGIVVKCNALHFDWEFDVLISEPVYDSKFWTARSPIGQCHRFLQDCPPKLRVCIKHISLRAAQFIRSLALLHHDPHHDVHLYLVGITIEDSDDACGQEAFIAAHYKNRESIFRSFRLSPYQKIMPPNFKFFPEGEFDAEAWTRVFRGGIWVNEPAEKQDAMFKAMKDWYEHGI